MDQEQDLTVEQRQEKALGGWMEEGNNGNARKMEQRDEEENERWWLKPEMKIDQGDLRI